YKTSADFVFTVTRDFVRACRTPVLILPDDIPAHPYAVAMEAAMLAPNAEVSMFPWKEPKERIPLAIRQIRSFLLARRGSGRLVPLAARGWPPGGSDDNESRHENRNRDGDRRALRRRGQRSLVGGACPVTACASAGRCSRLRRSAGLAAARAHRSV